MLLRKITYVAVTIFLAHASIGNALPFNQEMVGKQTAGGIMRPAPKDSIPLGSNDRFVGTREESVKLTNPIQSDIRSISNGRRMYQANCSVCHGRYLDSDSTFVYGALWPAIPGLPLYTPDMQAKPDGHFFQHIHFGLTGVMPPYGWKFSIKEHWDIVNYVRHVQKVGPAPAPVAAAAK